MKRLLNIGLTAIFALMYFYIALPAINLQSEEFYTFLILACVLYVICSIITRTTKVISDTIGYFEYVKKNAKIPLFIIIVAVFTMLIGAITSFEIFRSISYRDRLSVENGYV